jgi:Mrp family chromosome partitioning ATPase
MDNKQTRSVEEEIRKNISKIKNKILIISGKGGVGKTTVAVNLSYGLALKRKNIGLMDIDIHGPNVCKMLGIENNKLFYQDNKIIPFNALPNLKVVSIALLIEDSDTPIIWGGPLKMKLIVQFLKDVPWDNLDYLIIDSPPGTGDEPLSIAQLISDINPVRNSKFSNGVNGAIIVTTPQDVALLDVRKTVSFAKRLNIPILGIIENMSSFICPYCKNEISLFKTGGGEEASYELGIPFLGKIPFEPQVVELSDSGKPFISFKNMNITNAFDRIIEKIEKKIKGLTI